MPRKSKVDILAEKAAAGDIDALKELALLAKPKPKPKKKACDVQPKAKRKKAATIKVVKVLAEDPEPTDPEPEVAPYRANSNIKVIQQRRVAKVNEIQGTHAGKIPAKTAPFQIKERPNKFDVDKRFAPLHKKHLDEVKIHQGTFGVDRARESVEYIEVGCVYCNRVFVVPSNYPPATEDGDFCCNNCAANAKR